MFLFPWIDNRSLYCDSPDCLDISHNKTMSLLDILFVIALSATVVTFLIAMFMAPDTND